MFDLTEQPVKETKMHNTISLARQAIRIYPQQEFVPRETVNHLRRAWMRQIRYLGDHWIFAKPISLRGEKHV